jgi:cation transport regulator ChaC
LRNAAFVLIERAMLHFAYGSNMSRPLMRARCKGAEALGVATLSGWRFVINAQGFGSIAPLPGGRVHGVLWRLTTRDFAAINAYESIDSGLYLRRRLSVRCGERRVAALVYIARQRGEGRPRPGYIHVVVEAARDWGLSESYIQSLARWSSSRWVGARARDTGEVG